MDLWSATSTLVQQIERHHMPKELVKPRLAVERKILSLVAPSPVLRRQYGTLGPQRRLDEAVRINLPAVICGSQGISRTNSQRRRNLLPFWTCRSAKDMADLEFPLRKTEKLFHLPRFGVFASPPDPAIGSGRSLGDRRARLTFSRRCFVGANIFRRGRVESGGGP